MSGSILLIGPLIVFAPLICNGQDITLIDAGFESRDPAWSVPVRFSGFVSFATDPVRSGQRSLAIHAADSAIRPWVFQNIRNGEEGATVQFTAWMRGIPTSGNPQAVIRLEGWDSDNQRIGETERSVPLVPSADWTRVTLEVELPYDAERVQLVLQLNGAGTLWIDDVSSETIAPPKPYLLQVPNQAITEGEHVTLQLPVRLTKPPSEQQSLQAEIRIVDRARRLIETIHVAAPCLRDTTFTIQPQKLEAGVYALEFRIPAFAAETIMARNLYVMPKRKPSKGLSREGWFEDSGGKPFFPIGLYHVTTGDYPLVAAQGFNTVQGITTRDLEEFGKSLDLAHQNGLMVDVPLYTGMQIAENLSISAEKLTRFADHPAVLAWKIMDEPEFRSALEAEVFDAYRQLSRLNPVRPLLLNAYDPAYYGFWSRACDALIVDPYPLPDRPLGLVASSIRSARQAAEPWQHTGVSLQAGWLADLSNQPTFDQARTMVFLAILQGAQSIFWYSLHDPGWNLMDTPLWRDFPELNRLTATLAAIVRDGREERGVSIKGEDIIATNRRYERTIDNQKEEVLYILLANPSTLSIPVQISVPPRWKLDVRTPQLDVEEIQGKSFRVTLDSEQSRAVIFVR